MTFFFPCEKCVVILLGNLNDEDPFLSSNLYQLPYMFPVRLFKFCLHFKVLSMDKHRFQH